MRKLFTVAALCVSLVLTGCRVGTSPTTVSRYDSVGERVRVGKAPARGHFLLYATGGDDGGPAAGAKSTAGPRALVLSRHLTKGQRLGFVRNGDGAVAAVAGHERFTLDAGPHVWVMEAERGQVDRGRTAALVVTVLAVAGVIAAIVIGASVSDSIPGG